MPHNPLRSDDPRDWERLVESLGPPSLLVAIESRMSPELLARVTAEDVLQEVLLHLWRDRGRIEWRDTKSFRSLVLSIADHRIHDAVDREFAQKRGGSAATLDGHDSTDSRALGSVGSTTPSRTAIAREQADAMRAALARLSDEVRDVVRLRLFDELSTQAVADRLGLGLSATKHRFLKGAKLYREMLSDELASRSDASRRST